jgi:energy-coupling factor transport system permease protein
VTALDVAAPRGEHATGIHRVNPVAKLAVAAIIGLALVLSLDWVSAAVALALELVLLPFAGLTRKGLLALVPIAVAAPLAALTILLYGAPSGEVHAEFLLVRVSDGSIELAVATFLRLIAIALPSVALFVTIDPTDLADGLAQVLHLPSRFVLGALAALRLAGLFVEDWRSLELARRARGIGDTGRLKRFAGLAFALLVLSVRRGSKLATAMEARGFGAPDPRSWARPSRLGRRDAVLVGLGVVIAASAVLCSVVTGHWNPILG